MNKVVSNAVRWPVQQTVDEAVDGTVYWTVHDAMNGSGDVAVNWTVYWAVHHAVDRIVSGDQPVRAEAVDLLRSMGCDS